MNNAEDLLNFTKSEEKEMESIVSLLSSNGVSVVIVGANISDLALH